MIRKLWMTWILSTVQGFSISHRHCQSPTRLTGIQLARHDDAEQGHREEAEMLLEKARKLRTEIGKLDERVKSSGMTDSSPAQSPTVLSPFLMDNQEDGESYRLYIDIGREDGTWMDRRWGASGRRIPFSIDIKFLTKNASPEDSANMVKDNYMGQSSRPCVIATAKSARLRDGFDKMNCHGGCYRIDSVDGKDTVRFYLEVDGTNNDQGYGDISVPLGRLYFSIPCFGGKISNLSSKEGVVTVRQMGWNTGWRREESRIIGIFYACSLESAKKKDGF